MDDVAVPLTPALVPREGSEGIGVIDLAALRGAYGVDGYGLPLLHRLDTLLDEAERLLAEHGFYSVAPGSF
ncbi:hypothetical protein BH23GEM3_BH23GEM3_20290 [soil metagenome]